MKNVIEFLLNNAAVIDVVAKIAGIVMVIGLLFVYRQYKHSVKVAERNERRASVELAAQECARFGDDIPSKVLAFQKKLEETNCEYLKHCKVIQDPEQLKLDRTAVTEEDDKKIAKLFPEVLALLNSLEGFAIPFASGVADDKVGFTECGRSFVAFFENLFPLYRVNLQNFYQSTQILYWRWKKLASQQDLERQHAKAGKEFFVLTEQLVREKSKSRIAFALATWFRSLAERLDKPRK